MRLLLIQTHNPVGDFFLVEKAGLLTYPGLFAPSRFLKPVAGCEKPSARVYERDLQQRVLLRIFTSFPFDAP